MKKNILLLIVFSLVSFSCEDSELDIKPELPDLTVFLVGSNFVDDIIKNGIATVTAGVRNTGKGVSDITQFNFILGSDNGQCFGCLDDEKVIKSVSIPALQPGEEYEIPAETINLNNYIDVYVEKKTIDILLEVNPDKTVKEVLRDFNIFLIPGIRKPNAELPITVNIAQYFFNNCSNFIKEVDELQVRLYKNGGSPQSPEAVSNVVDIRNSNSLKISILSELEKSKVALYNPLEEKYYVIDLGIEINTISNKNLWDGLRSNTYNRSSNSYHLNRLNINVQQGDSFSCP